MIPRKSFWITLTIVVQSLFLLFSMAQADEPYDLTMCSSGQVSMLLETKDLVLFSTQGDGITMSNHENNKFHGLSYRCIGSHKFAEGVLHQVVYCKFMEVDGDLVVAEGINTGNEGTVKFLYGTGKWQGITGGGSMGVPVARGKPISEGTYHVCTRAKGTYKLP